MSRVDTVTCLATAGVVQLTGRSVFAVTVEFKTGALMVAMPGPPTTTPCTLSVPFTTSSRKSPVGKDATELAYAPVGGVACTRAIEPFGSEAFSTVTVAPPARVRMRFIFVLLCKMRVAEGCLTPFRIGPLFGKARPRHVLGDARTSAADVLRRAGLCAGPGEGTCRAGPWRNRQTQETYNLRPGNGSPGSSPGGPIE